MLRYKIDVLQALKDKGINTTRLRREKLLSEGAIQRLRSDQPISWANIEQICKLLECQPSDFLIYEFN
jgi:putative transcriptional regulator